jgi:hypothetical protein
MLKRHGFVRFSRTGKYIREEVNANSEDAASPSLSVSRHWTLDAHNQWAEISVSGIHLELLEVRIPLI